MRGGRKEQDRMWATGECVSSSGVVRVDLFSAAGCGRREEEEEEEGQYMNMNMNQSKDI